MSEQHWKDEMLALLKDWPDSRIETYIMQMEARIVVTKDMLRELRAILRKRKKTHMNTGERHG